MALNECAEFGTSFAHTLKPSPSVSRAQNGQIFTRASSSGMSTRRQLGTEDVVSLDSLVITNEDTPSQTYRNATLSSGRKVGRSRLSRPSSDKTSHSVAKSKKSHTSKSNIAPLEERQSENSEALTHSSTTPHILISTDYLDPSNKTASPYKNVNKYSDENVNGSSEELKIPKSSFTEMYLSWLLPCDIRSFILVLCGLVAGALVVATIVLVFISTHNDSVNLNNIQQIVNQKTFITYIYNATISSNSALESYIINPSATIFYDYWERNSSVVRGYLQDYASTSTNPHSCSPLCADPSLNSRPGSVGAFLEYYMQLENDWSYMIGNCSSGCASHLPYFSMLSIPSISGAISVLDTMRNQAADTSHIRSDVATAGFQTELESIAGLLIVAIILVIIMLGGLTRKQRRQAESEKQDLNIKLESAKTELNKTHVAQRTISHELRTPLNSLVGMAELLALSPLTEMQRDLLSTMRNSASQMQMLVNDLLMLFKMQSGHFQLAMQLFSLQSFFLDIDRVFYTQCKRNGIEFDFIVDEALPPYIYGDSDRLRQILFNLISNAQRFTDPAGHIAVHVSLLAVADSPEDLVSVDMMPISKLADIIREQSQSSTPGIHRFSPHVHARSLLRSPALGTSTSRNATLPSSLKNASNRRLMQPMVTTIVNPKESLQNAADIMLNERQQQTVDGSARDRFAMIQFSVVDDGVGIPYEAQRSIFEPFMQASNTKGEGTGLGLAIASDLVSLFGGEMALSSAPSRGSVFTFTIRVAFPQNSFEKVISPALMRIADIKENFAAEDSSLRNPSNVTIDGELGVEKTDKADISNNNNFTVSSGHAHHVTAAPDPLLQHPFNDACGSTTSELRVSAIQCTDDLTLTQEKLTIPTNRNMYESSTDEATTVSDYAAVSLANAMSYTSDSSKSLRILVVDDSAVNLKVATRMLKHLGHSTVTARNGLEAFEVWNSDRNFDFVLMDLQMNVMNGYESTKKIREKERQDALRGVVLASIPIAACSASVFAEDISACKAVGMSHFCSKPLTLAALSNLCKQIIERQTDIATVSSHSRPVLP